MKMNWESEGNVHRSIEHPKKCLDQKKMQLASAAVRVNFGYFAEQILVMNLPW